MINLSNTFVAPKGFVNPTIKNYKRKIKIVNLTPNNNWNVPFKVLNCPKKSDSWKIFNRTQYILIFLIFNQL